MKKLVFLFIIIFSLTGCFCSDEKEEIRKGEEKAEKEMKEYLSKYYGINEVDTVNAENTENIYSCPSYIGLVSAYFNYQGKRYGILYHNGKIKDELTYENIMSPILNKFVDDNLLSYGLPNVKKVMLDNSDYYFKGKSLLGMDDNINSLEDVINNSEIGTLTLVYETDKKITSESYINGFRELLNKIKNNFKTYYDNKDSISLVIENYSNGYLVDEISVSSDGVAYKSYTYKEFGNYVVYWITDKLRTIEAEESNDFEIKLVDFKNSNFPKTLEEDPYKGYKICDDEILVVQDVSGNEKYHKLHIYSKLGEKSRVIYKDRSYGYTSTSYGKSFDKDEIVRFAIYCK